jgi:hypothetical protein
MKLEKTLTFDGHLRNGKIMKEKFNSEWKGGKQMVKLMIRSHLFDGTSLIM